MRIDFSEPECSNCFHCRTLGILNTQQSEPSNVIGSSVTSMPVSSGPVQALSHDSAAVGSTSTSSPVQALGHDSAAVGSTSTSSPVQALGHDSAAVGSTSTSSPVQAPGHDDSATTASISTYRFGSQTPSAPPVITSVSSEPAETLTPTSLRSDVFGSPVQATSGSGASATSTSSTSSPFQSSSPNIFEFAPAATSVSSAPTQAFGQTTFGFGSSPNRFGFAPAVTSDTSTPTQACGPTSFGFGYSPNIFGFTSVSSAPTQAFGPNSFGFGASATSTSSTSSPVQSSSPFGFAPAVTSVSSAPTQAFGPNTCCPNAFATQSRLGSMQAPAQATSSFGAFSGTTPSIFRSMQAPVQATFGSGASGTSSSSSFLPFGCVPAPPTNGSSFFWPMQNLPWTTTSLSTGGSVDWVRSDVGVLPATSSSNLFGPNPSTPTEVFGATPGSVSWPAQDFPGTGVNSFALGSSPSNLFGQNISTTGSNSGFPGFGVDYFPGSNSNPFGPNPYTTGGGSIFGGPETSSPQPFGFNAATTPFPSSSLSSPFYEWSCHNEQCISHPRYAPTPDGETGGMFISVSASKSHPHKSHEELRWEDYKQGNKGCIKNAVFAYPQMASPSIFASPSVPDHPQRTTFGTTQESSTGFGTQFPSSSSSFFTTFPPISSSVQRPHETAAVSSPASGSTTSASASGYSIFYGATLAPPSAATTSLPGMYFPTYGFGTMMYGTTPAVQVTTPVLQAYPFNGYIIIPFTVMSLQ